MKNFTQVFLCIQFLSAIGISGNPMVGHGVEPVEKNDFPFIVSIGVAPADEPHHHFCGGTLITSRHVLTARHCLQDSTTGAPHENDADVRVAIGSTDSTEGTKYRIKSYVTYENWARERSVTPDPRLNHDVAVVTLRRDVKHITPAEISEMSHEQLYGRKAVTAGWGSSEHDRDSSRYMRKAQFRVIPKKKSQENYEKFKKPAHWTENHLCTVGDPPACPGFGDSGGPLLVDDKVVGVNSIVYPATLNVKDPHAQNAHQSVHYYRDFIKSFVKNTLCQRSSDRVESVRASKRVRTSRSSI